MTPQFILNLLSNNVSIFLILLIGLGFIIFKLHFYYMSKFVQVIIYNKDRKSDEEKRKLIYTPLKEDLDDFKTEVRGGFKDLGSKIEKLSDAMLKWKN